MFGLEIADGVVEAKVCGELGGEMTSSQGMTLTVDTREPWPHPWERYLPAGWLMERGGLEPGAVALAALPLSVQIVYSLKSMCLMNAIWPLSFLTML
jgi:hypothetical protein